MGSDGTAGPSGAASPGAGGGGSGGGGMTSGRSFEAEPSTPAYEMGGAWAEGRRSRGGRAPAPASCAIFAAAASCEVDGDALTVSDETVENRRFRPCLGY